MSDTVEVPFEVALEFDGYRLDAFLARRLHRYSRTEIQRLIEQGRVFLRERTAKASTRVAKGEIVFIRYPRREEPPPRAESLPVLFEDEFLLAVDKPGGVLSHPTDKVVRNSITSILKLQFPKLSLHLAHRLDRETSGTLILAKDPETARLLTDSFTERRISKEYLALVAGRVGFDRTVVDLPIGSEGAEIKVRQATSEGGVPARTEFERLAAADAASLVRAEPKTGRLHQIRVHLASLGHPVLGDKLYTGGGEKYMKAVRRELTEEDLVELGAPRQMLHAWKLRLYHPRTGAPIKIIAQLPDDFLSCLAALGLPVIQ